MTTIYYSQSYGVIIMSMANTYVRARIDTATKVRASKALNAMGLTVSDAIRLLMLRIADEHRLPFEIKGPNAETRESIVELESGKGEKFTSVNELMADINAVD
jgi:DNA-damage-inducible protein J